MITRGFADKIVTRGMGRGYFDMLLNAIKYRKLKINRKVLFKQYREMRK